MNLVKLNPPKLKIDEKITVEARGIRVKRLRNLANLSRKDMCKGNDLNVNTLKGWEIGRYGGLTSKGAEKIIARIAQEGVSCTVEWLLYEIGNGPNVVSDFTKIKPRPEVADRLPFSSEKQNIAAELMLFRQHYSTTVDMIVNDDGMLPVFEIDQYVAGVPYFQAEIEQAIGKNCIIQTAEGHILLRQLRSGSQANCYTLLCINSATLLPQPVIYDTKIMSAAPVIWQRRKY